MEKQNRWVFPVVIALMLSIAALRYLVPWYSTVLTFWYSFALLILGGISFYWVRENARVVYGILEVIVALCVMALASYQVAAIHLEGSQISDYIMDASGNSRMLTLFFGSIASVYLFVRGFDNLTQGLKGWPTASLWWSKYIAIKIR